MYLLAKRQSKKYLPASNYLLSVFNMYNKTALSETNKKHLVSVCNCMVYNLTKTVSVGSYELTLCLDKNYFHGSTIINGQKSKSKPVNYKVFRMFIDIMVVAGCELRKGGGIVDYGDNGLPIRESSVLTLSERIFESLFVLLQTTPIQKLESVLELRDENKKPKTFKSVEETQLMISDLKAYNNLNEKFDIRDGSNQKLIVNSMRIFNMDFQSGGRFYNEGGVVQSLPSEERKLITIDGEEVTECDFVAMHLSILATQAGFEYGKDFDPYGIVIKGYDKKLLRKLTKMAILIRLNCRDDGTYKAAFCQWISNNLDIKELYATGKIPQRIIDPMEILEAMIYRNDYLMEKMDVDACIGKRLQCVDGSIAALVLNFFVQQGKCVLCVHDSFITKKKDQDELVETMRWAYEKRLGSSVNCIIDIKY